MTHQGPSLIAPIEAGGAQTGDPLLVSDLRDWEAPEDRVPDRKPIGANRKHRMNRSIDIRLARRVIHGVTELFFSMRRSSRGRCSSLRSAERSMRDGARDHAGRPSA
jgi:hypothetical protein